MYLSAAWFALVAFAIYVLTDVMNPEQFIALMSFWIVLVLCRGFDEITHILKGEKFE